MFRSLNTFVIIMSEVSCIVLLILQPKMDIQFMILSSCKHLHQVSGFQDPHWYCKDCGKGLTPGAKDRRLEVTNEEILDLIRKNIGYQSMQETNQLLSFAHDLIKLAKEIHRA